MSTIKAANIQNPSAASAAIVLDTSGNFSVPAGTVSAPGIQAPNDSNTGIFFPAADTIAFAEGGAEAMRIDSSSRLLVGTSTSYANYGIPLLQLEASSGVEISTRRATTADGSTVGFLSGYSTHGIIGAVTLMTDGTQTSTSTPGAIRFLTQASGATGSPAERMRIDNAGKTNIVSSSWGLATRVTASAGTSTAIYYGVYGATNTGDGTISYQVWSNGNVQNTNNSYTGISDIKLKENIVDAHSQWADIKALQVRNYNLKEGQTHKQIGLIAQEVELISPGLISESPDLDAEGNDLGTVTKAVNYSVLYMKAVKALQEAMERIEQLEAEMAEVKAQLS